MRNYTRWRQDPTGVLHADILGEKIRILVDTDNAHVNLITEDLTTQLTPDEARLYGVRLVEAAALADGHRAIRKAS